jgi:hypothetical protein
MVIQSRKALFVTPRREGIFFHEDISPVHYMSTVPCSLTPPPLSVQPCLICRRHRFCIQMVFILSARRQDVRAAGLGPCRIGPRGDYLTLPCRCMNESKN